MIPNWEPIPIRPPTLTRKNESGSISYIFPLQASSIAGLDDIDDELGRKFTYAARLEFSKVTGVTYAITETEDSITIGYCWTDRYNEDENLV